MTVQQSERRIRRSIWIQSALIVGFGALPIGLVLGFLNLQSGRALSSALALGSLILLSAWICLLLVFLFVSRLSGDIRARRAVSVEPAIRRLVAEHASGMDRTPQLRMMYKAHPEVTEGTLMHALSQVLGSPQARMRRLVEDLGMRARIEKRCRSRRASVRRPAVASLSLFDDGRAREVLLRALKDHEGRIRIDASRALARIGGREEIKRVFEFSATQPLLVRAFLAEDLRPHALMLAESCIPGALSSRDPKRILSALEAISAWQITIPLPSISLLLGFPDAAVRSAAFRVLHYVGSLGDAGGLVSAGLRDSDPKVRVSAAIAAGRLRLAGVIPDLEEMLFEDSVDTTLAAAMALSELGESGLEVLERAVAGGNPRASGVALESLERVRIGRHDYARS